MRPGLYYAFGQGLVKTEPPKVRTGKTIAVVGSGPSGLANKKGEVTRAVLVKLESKKDEKTGHMMMVPVEGSEQTVKADLVLIAAGFLGAQKYVTDAFRVELNPRTNVATKPDQYATSVPKVLRQAICTEDSRWSYGRFVRGVRQQRKSTSI